MRRRCWAVLVVVVAAASCGSDDPTADPAALGMRVGVGFFDGEEFDEAERWLFVTDQEKALALWCGRDFKQGRRGCT